MCIRDSGDADEDEQDEIDAKNEELEREAWEAWQQCVDWCEENCDFHSLDEGVARGYLEEDRDEAWDTWINLERIYTVRAVSYTHLDVYKRQYLCRAAEFG